MGSKCEVVHPVYKNVCDYYTGDKALTCSTLEADYGFNCTGCTCAVETGKCPYHEFQGHQVNCDYLYWSHGWYCEYLEKVGYDCAGCSCPDPEQCQIDQDWGTTCDYWVDTGAKLTGDTYTCAELETEWHMNCTNCQSCTKSDSPMTMPSSTPTAPPTRSPSRSPVAAPTAAPNASPSSAPSPHPTGGGGFPTAPTFGSSTTTAQASQDQGGDGFPPAPAIESTTTTAEVSRDQGGGGGGFPLAPIFGPTTTAGAGPRPGVGKGTNDSPGGGNGTSNSSIGGNSTNASKGGEVPNLTDGEISTTSTSPEGNMGAGRATTTIPYTPYDVQGGIAPGQADSTSNISSAPGFNGSGVAPFGQANSTSNMSSTLGSTSTTTLPITDQPAGFSRTSTTGSETQQNLDQHQTSTTASNTIPNMDQNFTSTPGSNSSSDAGMTSNVTTSETPVDASTLPPLQNDTVEITTLPPLQDETGDSSTTTSYQSTWELVFRQTIPYAFAASEWTKNALNPLDENYAVLDALESFRWNGSFTFKLSWPRDNLEDQVWRQDTNPIATAGDVKGYVPISVPYTGQSWGGLERGEIGTLLDGSIDSLGWWYAVGAGAFHKGYIPGPSDGTMDYLVSQVELWAKRSSSAPMPVATPAPTEPWKLLFRQTVPYTFSRDSWKKDPDDPLSDNFAVLDALEDFRADGVFTFKLRWPRDMLKDQIWMQESNPVATATGGVNGYKPIDVPYTGQSWGGLEHGEVGTLLDGSVGSLSWWYSVGAETLHNGLIPGPANGSIGVFVSQVELWVKQVGAAAPCPTPGQPSANETASTTEALKDLGGGKDQGGAVAPPELATTTTMGALLGSSRPTATGDPHLVNVRGEHFDINWPGSYTLLRVPGDASLPALVHLRGRVESEGQNPCNMFIVEVEVTGTWFDGMGGLLMRSMRRQSASALRGTEDLRAVSSEVSARIPEHEVASPFAISVGRAGPYVPLWEFAGVEGRQDQNVSVKAVLTNQKPGGPWSARNAEGFFKVVANGAVIKIRQKRPGWGFLNVELLHLDRLGTADIGGLLGFWGHPDQKPSAQCLAKRAKKQRRLAEKAQAAAKLSFHQLPGRSDKPTPLESHEVHEPSGSHASASLV